ncbi:MAG: chloride channel protein [Acidimicrobiia bacterium]
MSDLPSETPVTRSRAFWVLVGYAAVLGLVMGAVATAFIWLVEFGVELLWPDVEVADPGLFSGQWWFIPLIGVFGCAVGLTRRLLRVEPEIPGLFEEIQEGRVEPKAVPRRVAVAFVSLISGASVGPEAPLAAMGGGLGTWIGDRRGLEPEFTRSAALSGMAGAFGGFFAAPVLAAILVVEAATPAGPRRYVITAVPALVSASIGLVVYSFVAGGSLLGIYEVPPYDATIRAFVVAVPLGVFGAFVAALFGMSMGLTRKATIPLRGRPILLGLVGGLIVGAIGWAMPLTMFAGTTQLATALDRAPAFGAGLIFLLALGKIAATGISFGTSFYGGPIFPLIFIGGVSGAAVHALIPDIPLGLAVVCLFAAVPGAVAQIPFTLVMLAALGLTLPTPMEAAPAALATAIAYSIYTGFLDRRPRPVSNAADPPTAAAN